MTQLLERAIERLTDLSGLPEQEQERIAADVLALLATRGDALMPFRVAERKHGVGEGTVTMAPDFDDELPGRFWLGEE